MKYWRLFFTIISILFIGCGQTDTHNISTRNNDKLTCLLLGYDSIIYYTGNSSQMQDVRKGKITDTVFVNAMFQTVKDRGILLTLKPGGGADVLSNFQEMISKSNNHGIMNRKVDTSDNNEEKAFGFSTPLPIKAAMLGKTIEPLKLNLPRNESTDSNAVSNFPKASQLVILSSNNNDIYAYMGGDIRNGKKYTYQELTAMLKGKRSDKNFSVIIRPAQSSTYKNTVDILDVMTAADIKHYALVDITKEEEDYLLQIY